MTGITSMWSLDANLTAALEWVVEQLGREVKVTHGSSTFRDWICFSVPGLVDAGAFLRLAEAAARDAAPEAGGFCVVLVEGNAQDSLLALLPVQGPRWQFVKAARDDYKTLVERLKQVFLRRKLAAKELCEHVRRRRKARRDLLETYRRTAGSWSNGWAKKELPIETMAEKKAKAFAGAY
jgi:hypothetical protein